MKKLAISAFAVPAGKGGIRKWLLGGIACFEMRLTALLSMRKVLDDIEKFLILRKLRSSYLEGRNALIQPIVVFLTPSVLLGYRFGTGFSLSGVISKEGEFLAMDYDKTMMPMK